ncbi:MAG: beta-propeller domain-containing protein [Singulisphaera sp.]
MLGELKVPGFSRYLHPVDATHLLGSAATSIR